ncbi:MAG TPA: tRNA lysidine(34) synthetase TilS [Sphingomicrobium sp.]
MASAKQAGLPAETIERFRRDLDALVPPDTPIGVAVSGGPDSLALLLLAAQARPARVEAATIDHALRPESRAEAEMVAALCERLGVPHAILTANWEEKPSTAIQERARAIRYKLLGEWARNRRLGALATAHHLDDQAETLLMRLTRGAGVRGLAGMRRVARPGPQALAIVRPLLGWRHSELEDVCASAGVEAVADPSNEDEQFERVRIRKALASAEWLDAAALAASAAHLAQADAALHWATDLEWKHHVTAGGGSIVYRPDGPREIRRRVIRRAILALATEGGGELRGREIDQVIGALRTGRRATLRGVLCVGGPEWRFSRAPARRARTSADAGAVEG